MSVGDVKGARIRFKNLQKAGHAPMPKGRSVSDSISRERALAARMNKISSGSKKK